MKSISGHLYMLLPLKQDEIRNTSFARLIIYGISHDRGGHLFPFLHKNLDLKYKTSLGVVHSFT